MTRPELHALVDIVMDARERTDRDLELVICKYAFFIDNCDADFFLRSHDYPTFSDFTQAVKEYIKTLE